MSHTNANKIDVVGDTKETLCSSSQLKLYLLLAFKLILRILECKV